MNNKAVDYAIQVLNEALSADPDAINELMRKSVLVNEHLASHPTIQVGYDNTAHSWTLRPLGLINGLFGADVDSWGFICMRVDENGRIERFERTPGR